MAQARLNETVVDIEPAFPANGDPPELVQEGEGLLHDVAQFAQALDVGCLRLGDGGSVPPSWQAWRKASLLYPLSASRTSKRRRGRPGRPAIGG